MLFSIHKHRETDTMKLIELLYWIVWVRILLGQLAHVVWLYRRAINPLPFLKAQVVRLFGWPYYLWREPQAFYYHYWLGKPLHTRSTCQKE